MTTDTTLSNPADLPVDPPPERPGKIRAAWDQVRQRSTFVWTVGFAFAVVALQLGQGILLARLLGPEGRGQYATCVLYVQMLLYVGLFGGLEVICRYAADAGNEQVPASQNPLRRAALRLGMTTGIATMAVVVLLNVVGLPEEKRFLMPLALICSLSMIGQHVMLIMTAVDRGSGDFRAYNWRRFMSAAAFPGLLLAAFLTFGVDLRVACWMFVAASALSMVVCVVGVPQPLRGASSPPVRSLVRESRPYGVSMLATDLFERLDLLLVMWLTSLVTQGYYAAMVPVVYPLTVIPNTLGLFLFNAGADSNRRLKTADVHRILGSSLAVQAATLVPFLILIGPLVRLVYGEEFSPAIQFAWWLAPVSALKGILQGLDSYVKGRGRPLASILCRVVAAVAMVALTLMLIDQWGAVAIAFSALVGQIICLVWISAIVYADVHRQHPASVA
ncbi:lipopolysaccharide biosynthesis protein [Crateriforma spongiae]|uniref:lipopolysaccharide biosynthesis protein n=1 Tax=Crateriforma spongiae TaxID=2724528 RepID=UPI0039AE9949